MTTFETRTIRQGELITGGYFYDFLDIHGKLWRIITNHKPQDTKRIGMMVGNLLEVKNNLGAKNTYLPKLSIFLGSLVPGKIEMGDIKIIKEQ